MSVMRKRRRLDIGSLDAHRREAQAVLHSAQAQSNAELLAKQEETRVKAKIVLDEMFQVKRCVELSNAGEFLCQPIFRSIPIEFTIHNESCR